MGEASRRRAAAFESGPWPGSDKRCPQCLGLKVGSVDFPDTKFYSRRVATCADCSITWEPIDEALIWDRTDPLCSFSSPCENCAFRPGSPEQEDKERWKNLLASFEAGGSFYCHKGVPLDLSEGHKVGFHYPTDQPRKLRLCRGYLNTLGKRFGAMVERAKRADDEA